MAPVDLGTGDAGILNYAFALERLEAAISAASRIGDLIPNFSDRASVLGIAKTFEDLGVLVYNGAGTLIMDVNYLALAGKIVSVEARHAAAIRDLLNPKSADFSGDDVVVPTSGLAVSSAPSAVLPIAQKYVSTPITATNRAG